MVHFYAVFLWYLSTVPGAMVLVKRSVLWSSIISFLNVLLKQVDIRERLFSSSFFWGSNGSRTRFLPEDFVIRDLLYIDKYFSSKWFTDARIDNEKRFLELLSFNASRIDRII